MKKGFMVSLAVAVMAMGICSLAAADVFQSTMGGAVWTPYDSFSGTTLNTTTLWYQTSSGSAGALVNNALTVNASSGGDYELESQLRVSNAKPFAVEVQFSGLTASAPDNTCVPNFGVAFEPKPVGQANVDSSWFLANGYPGLSGAGFMGSIGHGVGQISLVSGVTSGYLGLFYDGAGNVYEGYNIGSGWQTVGTGAPSSGWASGGIQILLHVTADPEGQANSGSLSVTFNNVQTAYPASAVPLPAAVLLFGPGLVGLAGIRRKLGK